MIKSFILLILIIGECVWAQSSTTLLAHLKPKMWASVRGSVSQNPADPVVAKSVEEVKPRPHFDPEKMEITAIAGKAVGLKDSLIQIMNYTVMITENTRFENADRKRIQRFFIKQNEWIKVKLRITPEGRRFARTIQRIAPRDRFKVFGQIQKVSVAEQRFTIGGIELTAHQQMRLALLADKNNGNPLDRFFQDEQKSVLFSIQPAKNMLLGGQLFSRSRADKERDLRKSRKKDKQIISNEFKLDALWHLADNGSFTFVEAVAGLREQFLNQTHDLSTRSYRLEQAYAYWVISRAFTLQAGRQDFDDEREWLYNHRLDGLRLRFQSGRIMLEVSASREPRWLRSQTTSENVANFIGLLRYHVGPNAVLSAYAIQRKSIENNRLQPRIFGLRYYHWPRRGFRHWLELARSEGRNRSGDSNGYAVDTGMSYVFRTAGRPTITGGIAYAGGDKNTTDQSGAFHQTGLQKNNARLGGVTSFRYYGEVLDPELSNRIITTLGIDIRPIRNLSMDVVFHTFRQDKPSADLGDTRIKSTPNGRSKNLGKELDLIVGYRLKNWANMELVLGQFNPGNAFTYRDPARLAQFQIRMSF